MNDDKKFILATIEAVLTEYLKPDFIALNYEEDYIHLIISQWSFKFLSVAARIRSVNEILKQKLPEIMKKNVLIIETFDQDELSDVLELVFSDD